MNGSGSTRVLTRILLLLIAVVAIAVLYLAKILALPLAFAILFAFLLAPLVAALERIHVPRVAASVVVILGFAGLLGLTGWMLVSQMVDVVNELPTYRDNIEKKIAALHMPTDSAVGRAAQEIDHLSNQLGVANTTPAPDLHGNKKPIGTSPEHPIQVRDVSHSTGRLDQLGGVLEPLMTAFLAVVFTFFVLLQREDLRNRVMRLSGDRNLTVMTQAMNDASRRISRYFSLQLAVNLVYGAVVCVALYFIGVPHPLLFGAIAAMCRFVPYIGPPVGGSLPIILALAVFPEWNRALMVLGVFVLLEIVTANFAEPHIYGRHTGLSSLAILIAAAFWTLIWGPVGLILSVPLTVCLVVMGRHVPALEFLTVLLGDQPSIPPWTCFYQRLLAGDEREASEIAESFVEGNTLQDVFDAVLVPALIACEQDRLNDDVDTASVRFVRETTGDLIDDLEPHTSAPRPAASAPAQPEAVSAKPPQPAQQEPLRVLCVPVRDETDELAARMLCRALKVENISAISLPVQPVDKMLAEAAHLEPQIVFLCGLPPVGSARPRRLYRSLRARNEGARVMAGIWGYAGDPQSAAREITGGDEQLLFASITAAVREIQSALSGKPVPVRPEEEAPPQVAQDAEAAEAGSKVA